MSKRASDALCDVFKIAAKCCIETNEDIVQMTLVDDRGKPVKGVAIIGIGPHAVASLKLAVKLIDRARGGRQKKVGALS